MLEELYTLAKESRLSEKPLHTLRMKLEGPIFDTLRERYGKPLQEFWDSAEFPARSENTVLMVERRAHPNLEFCLQNFMYFTRKQNFSLTIVCSRTNEEQIRKILGNHIHTTDLRVLWENNPTEHLKAQQEYSALFQSAEFWESIHADTILSVQTDCYLRKPLPNFIWDVDYIASPWAWKPWVVGGSGLTFRKKEAVVDMCKRVFMKGKIVAEDEFFAHMCIIAKKKVLPLEIAETIFSESRFVEDPIGVHQWWTYLFQCDLDSEKEFINKHCEVYMALDL